MAGFPPSYVDATNPTYPPEAGEPSAPTAPYPEKSPYPAQQSGYPPQGPYPPTQQASYPPEGYAPQGQPQGYPPQGQPQGYPPQGQPPQGYPPQGQPQGYPPQGQPQGYPPQGQPQGYPPQGQPQGYPQQPYTKQPQGGQPPQAYTTPQAPPATNVTVVTQHNVGTARWYGGSSSFTGIIIYSVIAIFCCFPLGVAAFIVAIWAYSEFSNGNVPKAIGLSRLSSGLATTAFVFGIITIVLTFSVRYTIF